MEAFMNKETIHRRAALTRERNLFICHPGNNLIDIRIRHNYAGSIATQLKRKALDGR